MNRDQLLDAIGNTGESMLKETEQLRLNAAVNNATATRNAVASSRRPARRKMMILLAACMILLLGTVAAYAAGWIGRIGGTAETGTDEEGMPVLQYYPSEDMRVPITAITGDILNSTAQMKENWRILSAGNQLTPYSDPLPDSSSIPFIVSTSFNTATEAAAYIGYADMVLPQFAQNTSPSYTYVQAIGSDPVEPDALLSAQEPDYLLSWVKLEGCYSIDGVTVYLDNYIITEANEEPRAVLGTTMTNIPQEVEFVSDTVTANNRQFVVVTEENIDGSANEDVVRKEYIWAENKVEYHLTIHYIASEATAATADAIAADWMNSFPNE